MMKNKISKLNNQKGFTLVEMAIAMIIVGLLIAFATVAFSSAITRNAEKKTFADMEVIADAISIYAQKHMRVPCPADPTGSTGTTTNGEPFGTEINSGAGDIFGQCDTVAEAEGIIPFATLGIPKRLAQDRFGNYITYRVSITSALRPSDSVLLPINNWCMTRPHWHSDTNYDGITDDYVALAKAAFCCGTWVAGTVPGVDGDIEIQGSFNASLPNLSRREVDAGAGENIIEYRISALQPPTRDELITPIPSITSTVPPLFPAYILVSHGRNGAGAFAKESGVRNIAGMIDPELENVNNDVVFFAPDRLATVSPGAGFTSLFYPDIDDIIFWATPSQTLGRIGGVSCNAP